MSFGSFTSICAQSMLPICSLLGPVTQLTTPPRPLLNTACTPRPIELANTIIFSAATSFAHIGALIMTTIMILHVRSKFTAVGRKEILTFFYLYLTLSIVSLILDAGVIAATPSGVFPFAVAVQNGLISALCTALLINGFVGFQLYEDGTALSVWLLRSTSAGMFIISFAVSLLTFKGWAGLSPTNTIGVFIVVYIVNAICLAVYVIMQFILVVNTLQDRWPLGDLIFGSFFFIIGQVLLYVLGQTICNNTSHYLDAVFFATVCNLLGVMMVYKYWDSITKEDLEFSVGTKLNNWTSQSDALLSSEKFYDDPQSMPLEPYTTAQHYATGSLSKRNSFYNQGSLSNRNSSYDLEYDTQRPPSSAHRYLQHQNLNARVSGLQGHGQAQMLNNSSLENVRDTRKQGQVHIGQKRERDRERERDQSFGPGGRRGSNGSSFMPGVHEDQSETEYDGVHTPGSDRRRREREKKERSRGHAVKGSRVSSHEVYDRYQ